MNEWLALLIGFVLGAVALSPIITLWFSWVACEALRLARKWSAK